MTETPAPTGHSIDFLTYFETMDDPRQQAKLLYPLQEVLLLALCAVLSGAQSWVAIAAFGRKKLRFLRRFLPFEDGTPSHDQLGIIFSALDDEQFQACFIDWTATLKTTLDGVVAIDGKTLRRSFERASSK